MTVNFKSLPDFDRRTFMKRLGLLMGASLTPGLKFAMNETLFGTAYAQAVAANTPTYFVEINYRDQVDLGQVFVAPGLATASNLRRGDTGDACAMYVQQANLTQRANNVYLTPESLALDPHLPNIAFCDLGEMTPGAIHYHNSANRMRSPDCSYTRSGGMGPMFDNDPVSNFPQGCEEYYSAMPTPASLHNHLQKQLTPGVRNGVALKGITRSIHTVYHYAAGLQGGELDRMRSQQNLFNAFPATSTTTPSILGSPAEAELFSKMLKKVDPKFLQSRRQTQSVIDQHVSQLNEAQVPLTRTSTMSFDLRLTAAERTSWRQGVPEPNVDGFVEGQDGRPSSVEFQIWEQYALATKLLLSGLTRTVALEGEFIDIHNQRPQKQMEVHAKQCALPLARMIEAFKAGGIWDRTLIAIFTADGSRPPGAGYSGDRGKNTVVLAGGMIRGGYFGDVRVAGDLGNGHSYSYHMPDLTTGQPVSMGVRDGDNSRRVPGSRIWRTIAKAFGAPDTLVNGFAPVASASPLPFMLL
ncbi:MAG: DUF1501 domain-containing protein [Myxococcaceae bacterium]|nr:DUF1501 domain-containing protein [Myxococcaceae bacterium]